MIVNSLSGDSILRIKSSILLRRLGDSGIQLYHLDEQKLFSVRDLGAYLLVRLDGHLTLSEVIEAVRLQFKIQNDRFTELATRFLTTAFLAQLLEVLPARTESSPRVHGLKPDVIKIDFESMSLELFKPDVALAGGCSGTGCGASCGSSCASAHSDLRLKSDVKTLVSPMEKIQALRGVSFRWKNSGERDLGFIAQEVERVLPELVTQVPGDEFKSVKYGHMVAVLVEGAKTMWNEITGQNSRIARMEREIAELKARLKAREKFNV